VYSVSVAQLQKTRSEKLIVFHRLSRESQEHGKVEIDVSQQRDGVPVDRAGCHPEHGSLPCAPQDPFPPANVAIGPYAALDPVGATLQQGGCSPIENPVQAL